MNNALAFYNILVLFLLSSFGALRWTRPVAATDPGTPRHRDVLAAANTRHAFEESRRHDNGAWVHLKYDITLAGDLVVLSQEPSLRALWCGPHPGGVRGGGQLAPQEEGQEQERMEGQRRRKGLDPEEGRQQRWRQGEQRAAPGGAMWVELAVSDPAAVLSWPPGAVLAGDSSWGCTPPGSQRPSAFYFRLTGPGQVHQLYDPLDPMWLSGDMTGESGGSHTPGHGNQYDTAATAAGRGASAADASDGPVAPAAAAGPAAGGHDGGNGGGEGGMPVGSQPRSWADVFSSPTAATADTVVVLFPVEPVGFEHCFREVRLSYLATPPGHMDPPHRSAETSPPGLGSGSGAQAGGRWRRSAAASTAAGSANSSLGVTNGTITTLLAINMDPSAGGGSGAVLNASLPLVVVADAGSAATAAAAFAGLTSSPDVSVSCLGCYATLDAGVSLELVAVPQQEEPYVRLDYFRISMFGQLTISADVAVQSLRAASLTSGSLVLVPWSASPAGEVELLVGPVPLVISTGTEMRVRIGLSASAPGAVFTGMAYSGYVEAAMEFRRQWQEFRIMPPLAYGSFQAHTTQLTVPAPVAMTVEVSPTFSLKLWRQTPARFSPTLRIGFQSGPGAPSCSGLAFQLSRRLDLTVGLDEHVWVPLSPDEATDAGTGAGAGGTSVALSLGVPYLPWAASANILPQAYPNCPNCSGCLADTRATSSSARWSVGSWGACSASCGGGRRTRTVVCLRRIGSGSETTAPDSQCLGGRLGGGSIIAAPKPAVSQACNSAPCNATVAATCPDSCTAALLGNEQCDRECMTAECGYDNGYCAAQLRITTACQSFNTCSDCLNQKFSCGWCATAGGSSSNGSSIGSCMPGTALGPSAGYSCPGATPTGGGGSTSRWSVTLCTAQEPRLAVLRPAAGEALVAGRTARLTWTGGAGTVELYLRFGADGPLAAGLGLSADPAPNTGVFNWTLPAGLTPGSDYRVVVHSGTYETNFASSQPFSVTAPAGIYTWRADPWPRCSAACGGGARTRRVSCVDTGSPANATVVVSDSYCNALTMPPRSETCNTWPCQLTCPAATSTSTCLRNATACTACSCLHRPVGLGYVCGFVASANGEVLSCDDAPENHGGYQECCRRNGREGETAHTRRELQAT